MDVASPYFLMAMEEQQPLLMLATIGLSMAMILLLPASIP
jgi:hypothetical protein